MTPAQEQIRDQQKATWNKFSPGWRKWDDFTMAFLRPMGDEIVGALRLKPSDVVLDIATGTGEPGLSIAAALPRGRVVATDLAEDMLAIAKGRAAGRSLSNYETLVADVSALPFPDATFDAVSCRMGFMFFPDMAIAAREVVRVLKPGGRFATSVWDLADRNRWITVLMGVIQRNIALPPPPPDGPGMFRCAAPGMIAGLLREAGDVYKRQHERRAQRASLFRRAFVLAGGAAGPDTRASSRPVHGQRTGVADPEDRKRPGQCRVGARRAVRGRLRRRSGLACKAGGVDGLPTLFARPMPLPRLIERGSCEQACESPVKRL